MAYRVTTHYVERFWAKVDKSGDCWLWTPPTKTTGYGQFWLQGGMVYAHRLSYELSNGPIPDGMLIDHTCHLRSCVNPAHLRLGTNKQNQENRSGPTRESTSGVRGVHWRPSRGKWQARVKHNGRQYSGGYFVSLREAEAAVIELRNRLFTHNALDREF